MELFGGLIGIVVFIFLAVMALLALFIPYFIYKIMMDVERIRIAQEGGDRPSPVRRPTLAQLPKPAPKPKPEPTPKPSAGRTLMTKDGETYQAEGVTVAGGQVYFTQDGKQVRIALEDFIKKDQKWLILTSPDP